MQRYPDAAAMFAAGSLVRGEGTPSSDLDLVVVYSAVPAAYRESFTFGRFPVEAFVHDPQTLEYFFVNLDRASGIPALPQMVVEGIEIPGRTALSNSLKARAVAVVQGGPPPLDVETERRRRYAITDLLADLRGVQSRHELVAIGARLYEELSDYYLRSHGLWSGRGKAVTKALQRADAQLCRDFGETFGQLFRDGTTEGVIRFTESLLQTHGGLLFDGYRSDAPADWRSERHGDNSRPPGP
jgi:hypothetical protein